MNVPNRLSLLRMCLIPVCVLLLLLKTPACRWAALAVFCAAAFTDFLDGQIARRKGLVTDFGKFIDPVADKLLVLSAVVTLVGLGQWPSWICVVMLFRELSVDGLRLVAVTQGKVIAAGKLGKFKTILQFAAIIAVMVYPDSWTGITIGSVLTVAAVIMTIVSGVDYFCRNRSVLSGGSR